MNKIIISEAKPEDAKGIRFVQYETWLSTYPNEEFGISKADIQEKVDEMQEGGVERLAAYLIDSVSSITYIAKDGDKIIGYTYSQKAKEVNKIGALYILTGYQGKGIGKSLMEKNFEFLGTEKNISLEVFSYNKKAIEFYKKFGFRENGPIRTKYAKFPSGKELPEIEMIKSFK